MEKKQVTRKDVAEYAGVTETIVSYVMNNNRYVAKEKRERVLEAMRKLHYVPNTMARGLKGKRSNHILFIADSIANEHFGRIVEEMDSLAYDKGFLISLMRDRNNMDFVSQIVSRQIDGVVISSVSFDEKYITQFLDYGIHVILLGNRDYSNVDARAGIVHIGMMKGMENAVKLMVKKGRRRIAYIDRTSTNHHFSTMRDLRYRGFRQQMEKSGLSFEESEQFFTGFETREALADGIEQKLKDGLKLDAMICRNDYIAAVAMEAVKRCGLKIPDDIAIMGFDNSDFSQLLQPKLSTVQINRKEIARCIIDMLEDMLAGKEATGKNVETTLIERQTT
ncbi:MAG: HTH lacI-type domain-containing protein [Oscillospiraceae bacterium]|jgi:DNA-binding LacI/PurR family transcriptional regulator